MPLYGWKCQKCNHEFEIIQTMNEPKPLCPECQGRVEKQIGRTSFKLKGPGWSATGYSKEK